MENNIFKSSRRLHAAGIFFIGCCEEGSLVMRLWTLHAKVSWPSGLATLWWNILRRSGRFCVYHKYRCCTICFTTSGWPKKL